MCSKKLSLIVEKVTGSSSESKKHVEIRRLRVVVLQEMQLLIESLVFERKVHFRAGRKFFIQSTVFSKICYFFSNQHVQDDISFDESILK